MVQSNGELIVMVFTPRGDTSHSQPSTARALVFTSPEAEDSGDKLYLRATMIAHTQLKPPRTGLTSCRNQLGKCCCASLLQGEEYVGLGESKYVARGWSIPLFAELYVRISPPPSEQSPIRSEHFGCTLCLINSALSRLPIVLTGP